VRSARAWRAARAGVPLPPQSIAPSQTALRQALDQHSTIITEDLARAELDLQAAQSIVAQQLRAVVVIPLYCKRIQNYGQELEKQPGGGIEINDAQ